jgi:hypothetical protein
MAIIMQRTLRRATALFIFAAFSMGATARPQGSDDLTLYQQVNQLYQAGKYDEAADIAKRALALEERQSGPEVATALSYLAWVYVAQGRDPSQIQPVKLSPPTLNSGRKSNGQIGVRLGRGGRGSYDADFAGKSPNLARNAKRERGEAKLRRHPTNRLLGKPTRSLCPWLDLSV